MSRGMSGLYERLDSYLSQSSNSDALCLYIDFPFCHSNCSYCIYHSLEYDAYRDKIDEYYDALSAELKICRPLLERHKPDSIYFGGGTPTLWSHEQLAGLVDLIPNYSSITMKKMEAHPFDLTEQTIDFLSNTINIDVLSIGVQSFDEESCRRQNRTWCSTDDIERAVSRLHERGIWVNIDLVALFAGDEDKYWRVFKNDLDIACTIVAPDIITSVPNYRTELDYGEQVSILRTMLAGTRKYGYEPRNERMLSLADTDVQAYGRNDHWVATPLYWDYEQSHFRYSCSGPRGSVPSGQSTIAFGGVEGHRVYSYLSDGSYIVYSSYSFEESSFLCREIIERSPCSTDF